MFIPWENGSSERLSNQERLCLNRLGPPPMRDRDVDSRVSMHLLPWLYLAGRLTTCNLIRRQDGGEVNTNWIYNIGHFIDFR